MTDHRLYVSLRGDVRTDRLRGFGTGKAGASRTRRRWTPYFFANARIDSCCCQLSRRVRSNSSCPDNDIHSTHPRRTTTTVPPQAPQGRATSPRHYPQVPPKAPLSVSGCT